MLELGKLALSCGDIGIVEVVGRCAEMGTGDDNQVIAGRKNDLIAFFYLELLTGKIMRMVSLLLVARRGRSGMSG